MARLGINRSLGVDGKESFGVTWPVDRHELGDADMVLCALTRVSAVRKVVGATVNGIVSVGRRGSSGHASTPAGDLKKLSPSDSLA